MHFVSFAVSSWIVLVRNIPRSCQYGQGICLYAAMEFAYIFDMFFSQCPLPACDNGALAGVCVAWQWVPSITDDYTLVISVCHANVVVCCCAFILSFLIFDCPISLPHLTHSVCLVLFLCVFCRTLLSVLMVARSVHPASYFLPLLWANLSRKWASSCSGKAGNNSTTPTYSESCKTPCSFAKQRKAYTDTHYWQ